ncbi:putative transposase domain protein [Synechococcus sp. A18-40]|nr:putative transposase domain protein [Synechococcus sp. A18-40]
MGSAVERSRSETGLEFGYHLYAHTLRGIWLYLYMVIDVWSPMSGGRVLLSEKIFQSQRI